MKKELTFILLLLVFVYCRSQQVTMHEASAVALTQFKYVLGDESSISYINRYDSNGHTLLFEVVNNMGIAVLVTGNKQCLPVVGRYRTSSDTAIFRLNDLPCGLKLILKDYMEQVNHCFDNPDRYSANTELWRKLIAGENVFLNRENRSVEPLIKTRWKQRETNDASDSIGYNYYIESGENCGHCLAGCVAVAMGQVMNYWKWPVYTADNWQFDWCNMSDYLYSYSSNFVAERNAIARLLERCGKKADMDYGCNGSESNVYKAKRALDDYNYNNESDHQWRMFNRQTWVSHLKDNLDRGWPVIYGASGFYNGNNLFPAHAFVCDGYSVDGLFHFNWGWGDYDTLFESYFSVDDLTPDGHNYNLFSSALFDLRPPDYYFSYCEAELPLESFYLLYSLENPDSNLAPYDVTPKTLKTLKTAPQSLNQYYRTIPSGATAEYVAHKEVVLRPGFTAEYGSDFTARIEPCSPCDNRQLLVVGEESDKPPMSLRFAERVAETTIPDGANLGDDFSTKRIFPNPTNGKLTVSGIDHAIEIGIFDLKGKSVYRWFIVSNNKGELTLDVTSIPSGIYTVMVKTKENNTYIGRFTKK